MTKDKFYRDMTDAQLRAAHKEMKLNLEHEYDFWIDEYKMLINVAKERGLDLEDSSLSAKMETTKGYLEFSDVSNASMVKSEEPVEYQTTRGGKREGAGRPALGTTKKVSITLPDEIWDKLEKARGDRSMSAFLREIIIDGNWNKTWDWM